MSDRNSARPGSAPVYYYGSQDHGCVPASDRDLVGPGCVPAADARQRFSTAYTPPSDPRRVTLDLGNCNVWQRRWVLSLGHLLCEEDNFRRLLEGRAVLSASTEGNAVITPYPVNALNHPPVP